MGGGGGGVANYMLRLSFRNLREVSKSVVLRRCALLSREVWSPCKRNLLFELYKVVLICGHFRSFQEVCESITAGIHMHAMPVGQLGHK